LRLEAKEPKPGEGFLAFGPGAPVGTKETMNLSPTGDLEEAAANLFAMMRALDGPPFEAIAVMPVPDRGLGRAINDRLRRGVGPADG
jgi:L-threonylcarbamoyladenylate synthase